MAAKNFVLDTNVFLHDPMALFAFEENTVCIPIVVIEELDTFKKSANELGRNAREITRRIDQLRAKGNLTEGVLMETGGLLRVVLTDRNLPSGFRISHQADNRIIATALHIKESEPDKPTVFVTMDTNLRIRANALGIHVEDYEHRKVSLDHLYSGIADVEVPGGSVAELFEHGSISLDVLPDGHWNENQYLTLRDGQGSGLGRVLLSEGVVERSLLLKDPIWGVRPRNREQHFAIDACLQPDIKLVTLVGKAGTGKTLIALAAGLHMVTDAQAYSKLLVSRPVFPMGRDLGHLPGEIDKKLKPWMQPIHDNMEYLLSLQGTSQRNRSSRGVDDFVNRGIVEVEPLTYIRGRSIPNQYMIVDEAQNLTPHEIKTIITRAGAGTKLVFTGDPYQIDNPYVDSTSNGLTYVVERFKEEPIAATVTLEKGERSNLAELAANLL
jgi:PhoH-like ATPase